MTETEKSGEPREAPTKGSAGTLHGREVREIPVGGEASESFAETSARADARPDEKTGSDPIQVLQARVAELEDQRLRALAELDNTRKRMVRQLDDMMRSANDRLLNDLLEVVDNFERALKHANEDSAVDESKLAALKGGTELIYNQLAGLLARYDIKPIESVGLHFDPKYHEALVQVESDVYDEGIVAAEINIGYMIGERILRHARVAVSIGSSTSEDLEKNDV